MRLPRPSSTRRWLPVAVAAAVVVTAACSGKAPVDDVRSGPAREPVEPIEPVEPEPQIAPEIQPEPETEVEPEIEPEPQRAVVINGVALDDGTLAALEVELGWAVVDGDYWYDPVLGAVGYAGGPTAGFLPAGLAIGGALAADASAGTTGVFLNGRELPPDDLAAIEQLFAAPFPPDHYYLDAEGYYGYEGEAPLGNVFATIDQQQSTGGGGAPTETAGGWVGGSGSDGYYFDPESGCSVMAGDGVSC